MKFAVQNAVAEQFVGKTRRTAQTKFNIVVALVLLFFFVGCGAAQIAAQDEDAPIKVDTVLLTIPLNVSDARGRAVPGLKVNDFTVYQNGEEQDIELFLNEEAPMNVAIVLDTSYSTRAVLDEIKDAARDFIKLLRPEDRALVATFDSRTQFLSDLTADRKTLSRAIGTARISQSNGSDMPDAIFSVVNHYFADLKGRKAIVVLTDGAVSGRRTAQQTIETLQKSDVLLYPIIFKENERVRARYEVLKIITDETAGRFYEKSAGKLKEAFQSIAGDLRNQYLLGFYPNNSESEKSPGHIRVALAQKGLTVRAKKKLVF